MTLPTSLHIEPTTDCNARCPQCMRHSGASPNLKEGLSITEWSAKDIAKTLDDPYFKNLKKVLINGNYGDIVKHTHPKEFINEFLKRNIEVHINTNGGAQHINFWKWLGTNNVLIEFGIDGLEDTHHLYRRNTRFDVIINNAKCFINEGGTAIWTMNVFRHNEHQVDDCKMLAKELGFKKFKARSSNRFWKDHLDVLDKDYKKLYTIYPATKVIDYDG